MATSQIPQKWDDEADVIVVGGGNSGLPAAMVAHDKGAKVMVLEVSTGMASSLAMIAGGTPFAGTDFQKNLGIQDSGDAMYEEAVETSGGDPELWRSICDNQLATYEWLKSIGAKPTMVLLAPGHKVMRSMRFEGHGAGLCQVMQKAARAKKLDIRYKHRAERLIFDVENHRVIGVRAKHDNQLLNFKANKAVVLTTGGFIKNDSLLKEFGPEHANLMHSSPPTHMGDGLVMALDVGAATSGIGLAVCPSMSGCIETGKALTMGGFGGISVNRNGKRWGSEMILPPLSYNMTFKALLRADPEGIHYFIFDQGVKDAIPPAPHHEKVHTAPTVEELAVILGVDPQALRETIDEWNENIEKYGYDKKFGRTIQGMANMKEPPKKLDKPPYYGIRCQVCLTSMKGGLKINGKTQVVDQFGQVIPGLYAAGEIAGGLVGQPAAYYTGAMTLSAFTEGYIAGVNATK